MGLVPVKTHISLNNIAFQYSGQGHYYNPMYLWTLFFKVDGDTTFVDDTSFMLHGTATVVGTPGNHGDLPGLAANNWTSGPFTDSPYETTILFPIPSVLGDFETLVTPIPLKNSSTGALSPIAPGLVGCLAVLLSNDGTPDDDIPPGHNALNNSVQQALDSVIPTLGPMNQQISQAQIQQVAQQISSSVINALANAISLGNKILIGLGLENVDATWGNSVYQFIAGNNSCKGGSKDLACTPPGGVPLQGQTIGPFNDGYEVYSFTFQGTVIGDPLPLSMKRLLTRLGQPSLRKAMTTTTIPFTPSDSANSWANAIS
jgi:hypothetical protein